MTTTADTAPKFLPKDTYIGRHTRRIRKATAASFEAGAIAAHGRTREGVFWESAGSMGDGTELFCRSRYVANHDGSLFVYSASGALSIIHPADRMIRVLTA